MKWPTVPLSSVTSLITKGTTPTTLGKAYAKSGIPFLRAENLQNGVIALNGNLLFIDEETDSLLSRSVIEPNDVLISIAGTIGRVGLVPDDAQRMNCNQAVAIVRPTALLQPRFLMYWLMGWDAVTQMAGSKVTQTISNLSLGQIGNLKLPLPAGEEQSRIVELLDEADRLRRLRREADAKAARILPALFLKMFGDPATNLAGWPISTVGDVTTLVTSGSTPRGGAEVYVTEGPYIIRSQNVLMNYLRLSDAARITDETHQQMSRTWVQEGDVLLNITGASIGRVAWVKVLDGPANVNQHVCIIRPDPALVNPAFLSACLSLPSMQAVINGIQTGASRQAINHVQVRGLKVPAPPVRSQRDFAFKAQILEKCIEQSEIVSQKLDRLWEAVIKQAFSGRLTAQWREGHMQELLVEMTQQTRALNLPMPRELEALS